jgi:hypothetical protein
MKWRSQIQVKGKKISLGWFSSKIEAAKVYDNVARKYHKKFARTNEKEKNL